MNATSDPILRDYHETLLFYFVVSLLGLLAELKCILLLGKHRHTQTHSSETKLSPQSKMSILNSYSC